MPPAADHETAVTVNGDAMKTTPASAAALLIASALAVAMLTGGCELAGEYHDDNLTVQFGDTNLTATANSN